MASKGLKHIVPLVGPCKASLIHGSLLQESIEKLKKQLNLQYENTFPSKISQTQTGNTEIDLIVREDVSNKIELPKFVPIKKFVFDAKKYKISETELENAPYEFPDSTVPLVSSNTKVCTDYKQLKGVNNDLYIIAILKGISKKKAIYRCDWFTLTYWHSTSYFGQITKSKPGVMVQCQSTTSFNSKKPVKGEIPTILLNRAHPFKFAVYRTRMKKLLRMKFMNIFNDNETLRQKYHGLFRFYTYIYPETEEDIKKFEADLEKALVRVSKLDITELDQEAEQINSKIPWYDVNKILTRNGVTDFGIKRTFKKKREKPQSRYKD